MVPKLQSNNTDVNPLGYPVTSYDISLIVAAFAIGNVLIVPISGKLADSVGIKNMLWILMMFNTIFLIALAFAKSLVCMLISRTVNGMCLGASMTMVPIFLAEITDDHNRGRLGCLMGLFLPLGQLYAYVMGFFFSYKYFTLTCALPVLVGTIFLICFVPETPVRLLQKGKRKEAIHSLAKYRSYLAASALEKEIDIMEYSLERTTKDNEQTWTSLFSQQPTRRALLIGFGTFAVQISSGCAVLLSFMGPIFEQAHTGLSGNMTAILVGSLTIFAFFLAAQIVEYVGRKPLLLFSSISCSLPLFVLGVYFFMKENNFSSYQNISWLPVASILFFVVGYSFGIGPLPMTTLGELFTTEMRATALAVIGFCVTLFSCIFLTVFPILMEHIGVSGCMWIFSFNCLLGTAFIYFKVPETQGKSILEIQEMLTDKMIN